MSTGLDVFDTTIQKTNMILEEIEEYYHWQDRRHQAYAILRLVLTTLRDRLTVEDAARFGAQLPLILRGAYYDQWSPGKTPIKMNKQEFINHIAEHFAYDVQGGHEKLITFVIKTVMKHISYGEEEKIKGMLPKDLADLV